MDKNYPTAKRINYAPSTVSADGELIFYIDFKPKETLSYQILGPDLSEFMNKKETKEKKK